MKDKSVRASEELLRDLEGSARAAGLHYVHDGLPGIRRRRCGTGFSYRAPEGETIRDPGTLRRLRALAIPPAWTDVWICASPRGHLQATGKDARGRKQYLYHTEWAGIRNEVKFAHILQFAESLPLLRRRVAEELGSPGLSRQKILAAVVRLLEKSLIRIGNEEYLRENQSFGLTTLRRHHVEIDAAEICFAFQGKSGKWHNRCIQEPRVARLLRRLLDLPGQELFRYMNGDGTVRTIASEDVNEFLRETTGSDFTAKDIRTWHATICAAAELRKRGTFTSMRDGKRKMSEAVKQVAQLLGNRPSASRRYYIHPEILESYLQGALLPALDTILSRIDESYPPELDPMETAVWVFLEWRRHEPSPAVADFTPADFCRRRDEGRSGGTS